MCLKSLPERAAPHTSAPFIPSALSLLRCPFSLHALCSLGRLRPEPSCPPSHPPRTPPPLPTLLDSRQVPQMSRLLPGHVGLSPPSNPRAPPSPSAIWSLVLGGRNVCEAGVPGKPPRQVLGVKEVAILWCADRRLLLLIILSMIRSHSGPMGPAAEQGACGRCTCGGAGSPRCR